MEIKLRCENCHDLVGIDEINIRCIKHDEEDFIYQMKEAISSCATHSYLWTDKDGYVGFDSDKDLENYLIGVRKGFMDALFWICEYFGEASFFETLEFIQSEWRKKK
jgi:hypothetical protein